MERIWEPFLLGMDFWPVSWEPFDRDALEGQLDHMAGRGLQVLRLPLTWTEFQPDIRRISDRCLRSLEAAVNLVTAYRLKVIPAAFAPGPSTDIYPPWAGGDRQSVLEGQLYFVEILTSYFRSHRSVLAWELDFSSVRRIDLVEPWRDTLVPAAKEWDDQHPLGLGLTAEDLLEGQQTFLEGLGSSADFVALEWYGSYDLAALASSLILRLTGKRTLAVLAERPPGRRETQEALEGLRTAGALGAILGGPEAGRQAKEDAWGALSEAAAAGWVVQEQPTELDLTPEAFYSDPQSSWRALARRREGQG